MNLVEVSPGADPPVCKILDVGKFKYEAQKKAAAARKNQKTQEIKEIKMRPNIDDHDYDTKMKAVQRFIEEGDKVKLTLRFRGRELVPRRAWAGAARARPRRCDRLCQGRAAAEDGGASDADGDRPPVKLRAAARWPLAGVVAGGAAPVREPVFPATRRVRSRRSCRRAGRTSGARRRRRGADRHRRAGAAGRAHGGRHRRGRRLLRAAAVARRRPARARHRRGYRHARPWRSSRGGCAASITSQRCSARPTPCRLTRAASTSY